jgi:antirestriction protein ArdC/superfamily I DNA/RNA helicase/DNA polymerase III epsilon subunit-like protein
MQNKIIVSSYRAYSSREQARFIRQEANLLIEKANEFSTTSRRVNRRSAYKVLARSLQKTRGLPFSIRKHQALTELSNYVSLAKYNKIVGLEAFNTDLLPVSHPRSTRMHSMTSSALAESQMRWVLDDPRIKDEAVKSLLASAMFSPIDSPEHKYSMIRLENMPQGQVPLEVLVAAANPFAGKNSAAARRAREAVQLSDRFERWINMGRSASKRATDGFRVYVKRNDGSTKSLSGELLNQNMFDPNLVDIEMGKGKVATVPTKLGEGLEAFIKSKDSQDGYSSVEAEVPNGAQVLPESSIVVSDAPSIYRKDEEMKNGAIRYTDDKYDIVKFNNPKEAQTAIGEGQKRAAELDKPEPKLLKKGEVDADSGKQFWNPDEPVLAVYRRGKNTPLAFAQSWKDVNNEILLDEPNLDEDEGRTYTRPEPQTADDNVPLLDQADDIFKPTKKRDSKKKKKEVSAFPYEVPDRAYEFNPNEEYVPEFEFDDPVSIANDQMPEELEDALLTAVEPVSDNEKATGYAPISFTDGREEDVPAEAIAAAIREQGGDAEMALAQAYDKISGDTKNEKALLESRGDKEPVVEEAPIEDGEIEPSPSDKIIEDEIVKPDTKKTKSKKPISEEEPIAEIVDEGEEKSVPPLLKSLSEEELAGYKKDGDYRSFLPKNADLDTPEGFYKLDPNPVDPAENLIPKEVESEYPFYNAVDLANDNTAKDLTSKLEDAIKGTGPQGPGFGELDISDPNLETAGAPVSAEALRDALQLQGKDTDSIIEKINKKAGKAKAKIKPPVSEEPEVEPDTKEEEVKPKKAVTYKRSGNRTLLRSGAGGAFKDKEIADFLDENGFEWTGTIERDGKTLPVNSESASQTDEEFKAFARELRDRFGIDLQPRAATAKSPAQDPIDIDAPAPTPVPEAPTPTPSAPEVPALTKEERDIAELEDELEMVERLIKREDVEPDTKDKMARRIEKIKKDLADLKGTPETPVVEETPKEEEVAAEEKSSKYTKKRPEDLKPGDEVYIPGVGWRIVVSVSERELYDTRGRKLPSIWKVDYTDGNPYLRKTDQWKTKKGWKNSDGTNVDDSLYTRDPLGLPDILDSQPQLVIQTDPPEEFKTPESEGNIDDKIKVLLQERAELGDALAKIQKELPGAEPEDLIKEMEENDRLLEEAEAVKRGQKSPDEFDKLPAGTRATSKDLKGRVKVWIKQEDGSWVNIKTGEIVDELPFPRKTYGGSEWWNDYEFTAPENLGGEDLADDDDSDLVDEVIIDSVLDEDKPAPTVDDFIDKVQQRRKLTRAERKALKKEKNHRQQMLIKIIDSNFGPGSFDLNFRERRAVKAMLFDLDYMTTEELEDISRAVNAELGWKFIKNLPDKPEGSEQDTDKPQEDPAAETYVFPPEVLPTEEEVAEAERQRKLKAIRDKKKREREDKLIEEDEKAEKEKAEKEKPEELSKDKKKVLKELVSERRKLQDAIDEADLADEVKPEEKKALKDALDELTRRIDEIVLSAPDETPKPEPTKDSTPSEKTPQLVIGVTTDQLKPGDVLVDGNFTITKIEREGTKKVNVGGTVQDIPAYRITGYFPNSVEQSSKLWSENYATDLYRGATPPAKGDLPELNQPKAEDYGSEYAFPNQRKVKFKDRTLYAPKNAELEAKFLEDYAKYDEERIRRQNLWEVPKTSQEAPSNPIYATNIPASEIKVGDIAFRFNKFGAREFFTVTKVIGTTDGVTTIEGHYVGHQTQTKEWRSGTSIDVIRGETNLPKAGDKEPLDRPDKSLPNYGQLEKDRQAKIALADQGYKFNAESPMPKVSKPKLPPFYGFVELLLDNDADGASIQKALDEKGFIVFDFETLGNDVQNVLNPDAPIQAAAVKYVDGKKVDELNIYINPGQPLGNYYYETDESGNRVLKASRMLDAEGNPITDEWLATQPDLKEQLQKLVDFFGDKPTLVGQNVDFDINVLQRWAQKLGIDFGLTSAVDTLGIAKILQSIERSTVEFPENPKEGDQAFSSTGNPWTWTLDKNGKGRWAAPSNALNQLAKRLGIEVNSSGFHNALFDVEVTEKVLRKLLENVKAGDLPIGGTVAYANEFKKWMESLASQKQVKSKKEADKIVSDGLAGENVTGENVDSAVKEVGSVEEEPVTIVEGEESSDSPKEYVSPLYADKINEDWVKDSENTDFITNTRIKDLRVGDFLVGSDGEIYEVIKFEDDEVRPADAVRVYRANLNTGQILENRKSEREDGGTGFFLNGKIEGGIYRRKDNADKTNPQIETETIEAVDDVEPVLIPEEKPVKGEEVTPEQAETVVNDAIDAITTSKPDASIEEAVKGLNVDETVKEQVVAKPEVITPSPTVEGSPFHISADGITPVKPGDKVIHAKTKRVGFVSVLLDTYNKKYTNYVKVRYEDTGEREPVASKNLSIIYSSPEAGSVRKPSRDETSVTEVTAKIKEMQGDSPAEGALNPEELAQKWKEAEIARDAKVKEVNFVSTSPAVVSKIKENLPTRVTTPSSLPSLKTGNSYDVTFAFDKPTVKELSKSAVELKLDSEDDLIVFRASKDLFLRNQPVATIKPDGSIVWQKENDKRSFSLELQKALEEFESPITNLSAMAIMPEPEDLEGTDVDNFGNGTLLGESESSFDYNNISKFPPTEEQRKIVDAIMTGKDIVVQALAGTGKTSTLVLAAKRLLAERPKSNLLYIVFNKETAEEAQGRMPENVDSRTMDNIVYSMLPADYKDRNKLSDKPKIGEKSLIDFTDNVNLFDYYKFEPVTLMIRGTETTLGRNDLIQELREAVNRFTISGDETLTEKHFKKPAPFFDLVPKVLLDYAQRMWTDVSTPEGWDPTSTKLSRIDYSDMLKAWALTNPQFADGLNSGSTSTKPFKGRKNDLFFFDEAQDMNPVIVKLLANQNGIQRVYVGDSNQAIYAFRGAVDELNNIKDAVELYLTQTFRFGARLAAVGNRFLSTLGSKRKIVGKPGEDDGEIIDNMQDPDAIIARTNGGVIDAVFDMLAKGKNPGLNLETYYKALSYAKSAQWLMAANKGTPAYKKPKLHEDLAGFQNWNEVLKAVQDGKSVGGAMYMVRLLRDRKMSVKELVDKLNSITPIRGTGFRTDEYVPLGMDAVKVGTTGKLGKGKLNSGFRGDLTYTVKDGSIEFENAKSYQDFLLKNVTYVDREYEKKDGTKGTYKVPAVIFDKGQEEEMLTLINDVRRWVQNYAPRIAIDSEVITAHKSKGKEWNRVLLWDDYKEPELNDEGEMELPSPEERRISYVAATRAKKAIDIGDTLKWIYDVTSEEDEKPETIAIEELIGMSVTADPEPVTPEEIGNKVIKDRKITDAKTLEVANKLIELIEKGVVPWTKGWTGGNLKNPKTNHTFQGSNVLALWAAMAENNWSDPRFLSFNQAKAMGGFVRKGEKGTTILKPNKVVKEVKQKDGTLKKEGYIWFSTEAYFNVSQIENVEFPPLVKKEPVPILEIETQILESYKDHPEIIYRPQNSAFYRPSEDKIYLPQREQFDSSMTFIETLFHELGHSTGHISRLGKEGKRKDLQDNYGDHRASRGEEELIAEITVALIAAEFGVEIDWGNTASYAEGWLKPLKDDPGMIIVAARQAQQAVNWILGVKPGDEDNKIAPSFPGLQDYKDGGSGGLVGSRSTVGFVSTDALKDMAGNVAGNEEAIESYRKSLREGKGFAIRDFNGKPFNDPIMVIYDDETGMAFVGEGNHRLQAAIAENIPFVPVRVVRGKASEMVEDAEKGKFPKQIKNNKEPKFVETTGDRAGEPVSEGYVPPEMHPSFVFDKELVSDDVPNFIAQSDPFGPPEPGEGVGSEGQTGEQIADQAPETPEATPEPNVGEQGQTGEEIANKTPKNKDASVEPTKFTFSGEEYDLWDDITYDRESDRGVDNEGLENGHGIFATRLLDGQELITDRTEINNYISEILKKYGYGNKFFMLASAAVSDKSLGKDPMQNGGGIEAGIGRANNSLIPEGNPLREIEFPVFLARSRGISKVAMLHEIAHLMEAGWRTGIGGGHNMIWHQTFLTLLRQEGFKKEANLLALTIGEVKGDTGAINP